MRSLIGATYRGSIEEAHGATVIDVWDCGCCYNYSSGRVSATVRLGTRIMELNHARPSSFVATDPHPAG